MPRPRVPTGTRRARTSRGARPDRRLGAEQTANTFTDKEMTEDEEREWNELFDVVIGG